MLEKCALPSHVSESKMLFGYFLVTALLECFQCCLARLKSMYVHSAPGSPLSGWPAALAAWCIGCLWLEHFDVHPFGQCKFNVQLPLFLAPYPRQPPSPPFPRSSTPVSTIYFPFPVFPSILHFLFLFCLCLCLFLLFLFSFLFLLIFVSLPIWTLVNF